MTRPSLDPLMAAAFALLLAGALACAAPDPAREDSPSPPGAAATQSSDPQGAAEQSRSPRRPLRLGQPFWHDAELVDALSLDESQLSALETRRQAALTAQRSKRQAATELRGEMVRLIAEGAGEQARRVARELGAAAASTVEADAELKIAILETLTAEQRATLMRERPGALRRSWLLPGASRPQGGGDHNPILDGER